MIELLAVLVIVGLLLATFVPYALSLRESSNRLRCTSNLNKIWSAVRDSYMPANGYMWPRVRSDATNNGWTAFTGADDSNPFSPTSKVAPNDVTASLWLLVREGLAQPEWFVCPSGGGSVDRVLDASGEQTVVKQRGNFRSRDNLNYSYATPFSTISDYRLNDTLPSRFVLLADRAPAPPSDASEIEFDASARKLRSINSPNHNGAGQNVLYADGTVIFEPSPYCGVRAPKPTSGPAPITDLSDGDNIFTALAAKPLVDTQPPANEPGVMPGRPIGPAYRYDAVLVPSAGFVANDLSLIDTDIHVYSVVDLARVTSAASRTTTDAATRSIPATAPTTQP